MSRGVVPYADDFSRDACVRALLVVACCLGRAKCISVVLARGPVAPERRTALPDAFCCWEVTSVIVTLCFASRKARTGVHVNVRCQVRAFAGGILA
jgi:hypothetical protein